MAFVGDAVLEMNYRHFYEVFGCNQLADQFVVLGFFATADEIFAQLLFIFRLSSFFNYLPFKLLIVLGFLLIFAFGVRSAPRQICFAGHHFVQVRLSRIVHSIVSLNYRRRFHLLYDLLLLTLLDFRGGLRQPSTCTYTDSHLLFFMEFLSIEDCNFCYLKFIVRSGVNLESTTVRWQPGLRFYRLKAVLQFYYQSNLENRVMHVTDTSKTPLKHKKPQPNKANRQLNQWSQELKHKQHDYLARHNQIRSQYHNRDYKSACDLAFEFEPPQHKYLSLYYQDQLTSVNKVINSLIVRNQLNLPETGLYLQRGHDALARFYQSFVRDQAVTCGLKAANIALAPKMHRFLVAMVCYLAKAAYVNATQLKYAQASAIYESGFGICSDIMSSSTNNYKILRTVSEFLLCYAAFLIDSKETDRAIEILFAALKNETNIAIILSYRLKSKSKTEARNSRSQLYHRLYAILFNLAQSYQNKELTHHSYFFLAECELVSHLKAETSQKEIQIQLGSCIRNLKSASQTHQELDIILAAYFTASEVRGKERDGLKLVQRYEEVMGSESTIVNAANDNELPDPKAKQNYVRRSISLQDKLNQQNTRKVMQEFGQQVLFLGVDLFQKKRVKGKSTMELRAAANETERNQLSRAYLKVAQTENVKEEVQRETKLKKKGRVLKNTEFRAVRKPIEYGVLCGRFQNTWKKQSSQANKTKQSMYLLRYKSQYLNHKEIAKQNKHLFEEIQLCKKQPAYRQCVKPSAKNEEVGQAGINLFRQILLKHVKRFDIKKSETIYILKKKTISSQKVKQSYNAANDSISFLLERLKKQKDSFGAQNRQSDDYDYGYAKRTKGKANVSNVFLVKDTVEIPNLFISYITSQALNLDILSALLEYGIILLKHKQ